MALPKRKKSNKGMPDQKALNAEQKKKGGTPPSELPANADDTKEKEVEPQDDHHAAPEEIKKAVRIALGKPAPPEESKGTGEENNSKEGKETIDTEEEEPIVEEEEPIVEEEEPIVEISDKNKYENLIGIVEEKNKHIPSGKLMTVHIPQAMIDVFVELGQSTKGHGGRSIIHNVLFEFIQENKKEIKKYLKEKDKDKNNLLS